MIATVIPTRNEDSDEVAQLAAAVPGLVYVVDDSDPGRGFGRPGSVRVRSVPGAGSLGGSILTGMRVAVQRGASHVGVIDVGSHDPADLGRLVAIAEAASLDVVVGSRFFAEGRHGGPRWRSVGSQAVARLYSAITGYNVSDWTSGLRVYSRRAVYHLLSEPPASRRHAWQAEALASIIRAGFAWGEAPITYGRSDSSLSRGAVIEAARLAGRML